MISIEVILLKRYIRSSLTSGLIGIWWYTDDGVVFGKSAYLDDGFNDGSYIQYSDKENHLSLWRECVYETFDKTTADAIYRLGYKGLERGRVIYNLRTQSYEVTCSEDIVHNEDFRQAIIDTFDLNGCRYDFYALSHYCKLPLTGNPAIDKFNYEV